MGVSSDGLVWWGVAFDEESDERFETIMNGPDGNGYGDGREWLAEHGLTGKVEFVNHCSIDYTMYGIAVPGTLRMAYRGSPKNLGVTLDAPTEEQQEGVREALRLVGEDPDKMAFGWQLASMYG